MQLESASLVFSFPPSPCCGILVSQALSAALSGDLPDGLGWNFPVLGALEASEGSPEADCLQRRSLLQQRLERARDCLVPMGYAGLPHTILARDEVSWDLRWTLSNMQKSGLRDLFPNAGLGRFPAFLVPASDRGRKDLDESYRQLSSGVSEYKDACFALASMAGQADRGPEARLRSLLSDHSGCSIILCVIRSHEDCALALELGRLLRRRGLLVCAAPSLPEWPALDGLPARQQPQMNPRREQAKEGRVETLALPQALTGLDLPHLSEQTGRRRGSVFTSDRIRQVLAALYTGTEVPEDAEEPEGRHAVANMPGLATLSGHGFDCRFQGGRLEQILSGSSPLLAGLPARSLASIDGKVRNFAQQSAFSLEGDRLWGIRETTRLRGESISSEGCARAEYLFVEDFPLMIADFYLSRPEVSPGSTLDWLVPFDIGLCFLAEGQTVRIGSFYPDSGSSETVLNRRQSDTVIFGSHFIIEMPGGPLYVQAWRPGQERIESLCLRFSQPREAKHQGGLLSLCPAAFGGPEICGQKRVPRYRITLFIGPADQVSKPPLAVPAWLRNLLA